MSPRPGRPGSSRRPEARVPAGTGRRGRGADPPMRIESSERQSAGAGRTRWSARVGGEPLFFEVDEPEGTSHANPADSFAAMGLAVAMLRGEPLEGAAAPVSE